MVSLEDLYYRYGIKIANSLVAKSKNDALDFAKNIGFPVALKIESPDILHKTEIGGVALNIKSMKELEDAYEMIVDSIEKNKPEAEIEGVRVQEMQMTGHELIIGYNNDPVFGPIIMLGMGGIFTEVVEDVVFRLLPITLKDASKMVDSLRFSDILFKGFRNVPKVSKDMLVRLICKVADMALDLESNITSFDLNPVIVWDNEYRVVDFKIVSSNGKNKFNKQEIDISNLDEFFNASSIALVGASKLNDRIGGLVLDSLLQSKYKGKIYPINPKYDNIRGLKSYKSILDVPDRVDLVVFTISLSKIPTILKECSRKNISNAIIISAGGKEIGEIEIEDKIRHVASDYGIRVIGCNCLGVFDGNSRVDTLFQPYEHMKRPSSGSISLITQSGTVGISYLELLNGYGVSKFVSYGNRIDVDEGDLIEFLAKDPHTKVISIYIEGLEKGSKFFDAAKKASKDKPVIVYKAGRTLKASKASLSHTGFLVGTHNLIKGVLDQANIVQVDSLESLIASAKTLSVYPRVKRNNALIITNGAGTIIQAIDKIIEQNKLKLAELSESSVYNLKEIFPDHVIIGNPIDLTGTATNEQYEIAIKTAVSDCNVDIIMVWFVFQCMPITSKISFILKKYAQKKPIVCGAIGAEYTHRIGKLLEKEMVPIFYSIEEWVSAAGSLYQSK